MSQETTAILFLAAIEIRQGVLPHATNALQRCLEIKHPKIEDKYYTGNLFLEPWCLHIIPNAVPTIGLL